MISLRVKQIVLFPTVFTFHARKYKSTVGIPGKVDNPKVSINVLTDNHK